MAAPERARAAAERLSHLTRRAYQYATVPRFRARGSVVTTEVDSLRLLYRPTTADWYVEHDERWYRPGSDRDLTVVLGELAVEILDEAQLSVIPHAGEVVWIDRDGATTWFDFHSSGGNTVARVPRGPGEVPTAVVRWLDPVHDDGWVDLTAALWVSGVSDLTLETYLPPVEGLADKTMSVSVDDGTRRQVRTTVLRRGEPTTVSLYRGSTPAWGLRIGLHCQYPEPAADSRELGFQLVSLERRR